MSERQGYFNDEVDADNVIAPSIQQSNELGYAKSARQVARQPEQRSRYRSNLRQQAKKAHRSAARYVDKFGSKPTQIQIVLDEATTTETSQVESLQLETSYDPRQENAPSKTSLVTQPPDVPQAIPISAREGCTIDGVSDDLFDLLSAMAHKNPEDHGQFVAAVDMLNTIHHAQNVDLMQMQEKMDNRDEKIAVQDEKVALLEQKVDDLDRRKDTLLTHIDELKTYYKNKVFHAEYDSRILRAELEAARRDHEESKSGEAERKLKDQVYTLEARLNIANGHLYGSGGKFARKQA